MARKIIKVGKSARGSVIHIVIEKSNRALCEKKQVGLIVDEALTIKDVTCKRCMATLVFKKELASIKAEEEVYAVNKKAKEKEEILKIANKDAAEAKAKADQESKESFYKKKLKNGDFKLIHKATGKVFFSNIEEEVVSRALKHLNEIEEKWISKHDQIPKGFIPKCRAAVALAYKQSNVTIPATLKNKEADENKSKKRSIKRRGDKKQKISRQANKGKSKVQKLLDFVVGEMIKGISLTSLTEKVVERFELSQKKGAGKVKKTIRRLRKKNIIMMIKTKPNKNDDIYRIETD